MTGRQRLRVLAKYLTSGAVDEEKFDMYTWQTCAIGEGSHLPSLKKEGLVLEKNWEDKFVPAYDGCTGYDACARFFSLPYSKVEEFFGSNSKPAALVGKRLLRYLGKR